MTTTPSASRSRIAAKGYPGAWIVLPLLALLSGCANNRPVETCAIELLVLGAGQDAGAPQIGNPQDPAWDNPDLRLLPTSLALVDHRRDKLWLFEATPAIGEQLALLGRTLGRPVSVGDIDGIFVTHAHIGHYAGLMYLGREAAGASGIPVFTLPRLQRFLAENGPWSQLVSLGNVTLQPLQANVPFQAGPGITVTSLPVPHRDEYSETAAFLIDAGGASILFVPDIDDLDRWRETHGVDINTLITEVDIAFIDATFFDDDELSGRDMSEIPHPRVQDSITRFSSLPETVRRRVHFIHYNHTNAIRFADSPESLATDASGYAIARRGDRLCADHLRPGS